MTGFTMLWSKTLDSSVWRRESKETRLVWVTMLMMKDAEGVVHSSKVGLADRARVTDAECEEALRVLLAPDANDTSGVEEGRRIREVAGGWQVVNHDVYRFSTEAKREFWRATKAAQRKKLEPRAKKGKPLPGEEAYVRGYEAGHVDENGAVIVRDAYGMGSG
jgi:hypothetical protein